MTRLVVFDLDGTLVDSGPQIIAAMRAGYAAAGRAAPPREAILSIVGISLPNAVDTLSPGIREDERDAIVAAYRATFVADPGVPPLYPGAAEVLAELASAPGTRLSVATGKAKRGLLKVLDQHGLRGLFASLHGGDEYPSKPDPSMLRAALGATGVGAAQAVMVGDSVYDMAMARAAGVRGIGVAWGYHAETDLRSAGADAVIRAFPELPAAIGAERGALA